MKVGQKVKVTDQKPAAEGEVVGISTWGEVLDNNETAPCYRVRCQDWKPNERWIGAIFVTPVDDA